METKEYRGFIDKAEWERGPWDDEPDKVQWADDATGLACLIVRGPHGGFCGYVGVPTTHPWHGKDYGQCTDPTCKRDDDRPWCDHTPEHLLQAHGGITFASGCTRVSREDWQKMVNHLPKWEDEARQFPRGDAARRLKTNLPFKADYDGWLTRQHAVTICHAPAPGESDNVWWFGFDCAHAGDLSPAYDKGHAFRSESTYRDIQYVRDEVTSLAQQLGSVAKAAGNVDAAEEQGSARSGEEPISSRLAEIEG